MGINIPEVERQKASKALNCDHQCPLWVKSGHVHRKSRCPLCANSGHELEAIIQRRIKGATIPVAQ